MLQRILRTGGKLLAALALTLFLGNLIASRTCNCPTVFDPLLGRVPKPGARFYWKVEGNGDGIWTSNGVRRTSLPEHGSEGCLLVMGDSYTEALHVTDDEHFAHLLEKRLRENNIQVPVLPVARSGFSVADYVSNASLYRKLFSPGWVIIQVGDDDFCNDAWTIGKPAGYAHFRRADDAGKLEIVNLPPQNTGLCGLANDRFPWLLPIILFMQDRENLVLAWVKDRKQPWFHAENAEESNRRTPGIQVANYPVDQEMKMLAEAYDKRVILLYLPQFDPLQPGRETENETLLRKAAQAQGIHFVSLREKFPELAAAGQAPYGFVNTRFNAGHWNRYGHQAAADLLFDEYQRISHAVH
jgi:hypothetical protein